MAIERFAADVAEGELDGAAWELDAGYAGEFADGPLGEGGIVQGGAGFGEIAGEDEAPEGAMDCAAGADALDDLLAEVAAFGEVEGAGLVGFLWEVFGCVGIADVYAVKGCAGEDAEVVEGFGGCFRRRFDHAAEFAGDVRDGF